MSLVRKRKQPGFKIYEDNGEPFVRTTPKSTQERDIKLDTILKASTVNSCQHSAIDVQKLIAVSNFKEFFYPRVQVSQEEINKWCGFSKTASRDARACTTIAAKFVYGDITSDPRGGHNRALSKEEIDLMDNALENKGYWARTLPWLDLAKYYAGVEGVSVRVLREAMNLRGWITYRPASKVQNFPYIKEIRLRAFNEVYQFWRDENFKRLRYSDEKHFNDIKPRTLYIRRRIGTRYEPENLHYEPFRERHRKRAKVKEKTPPPLEEEEDISPEQAQFDWGRIDVWGAVGFGFKSKLVFYDAGNSNGKMNQKTYLAQVLEAEVATWPKGDWILEEDRDSGHGMKGKGPDEPIDIQSWQDWEGKDISKLNKVMQWKIRNKKRWIFNTPDSPDMSIIENVWKFVNQKLENWPFIPPSREEGIAILNTIWYDQLQQSWIDALIIGKLGRGGMIDRWEDVRACNGEPTGY